MAAHRLSIKDVAQQLNISAATVSRALAGRPNVNPATRQRVCELAAALGFQVNTLAAGLRRGNTGVLGVLVPRLTGHFFPEVLHGISTAAGKARQRVIICESNDDAQQQQEQLRWLLAAQVDGLLVCPAGAADGIGPLEVARQQGVPVVCFNQAGQSCGHHSVTLDNGQGAYEAVSHLLAQGRTRIAHLTGPQHLPMFRDQQRGYAEALLAHGLLPDPQLVRAGAPTLAAGRQHALALLAAPLPPDAIFAGHELLAVGALQMLKEYGCRIPQDVALVAFASEGVATLTAPMLTALDQQGNELGQAAARLLLKLLADPPQTAGSQQLMLVPQLLVRASSVAASRPDAGSVSSAKATERVSAEPVALSY